ncbi:hypothetical protein Voc01_029210 [Virgisporangium ochraceum]|uniref:Uncharacterized protein n=1 Tax=Virgisporangium ochraceum TaxID=65505 RepID=A0A8J4EAX8_9ACTN|nr:hypothetical protein Voc01_029210 [Virgisporangium ochraceum]
MVGGAHPRGEHVVGREHVRDLGLGARGQQQDGPALLDQLVEGRQVLRRDHVEATGGQVLAVHVREQGREPVEVHTRRPVRHRVEQHLAPRRQVYRARHRRPAHPLEDVVLEVERGRLGEAQRVVDVDDDGSDHFRCILYRSTRNGRP